MAVKYMHLIDGKPAYFLPKHKYICYADSRSIVPLADSLHQIRREQRLSLQTQRELDASWTADHYGYCRVRVV